MANNITLGIDGVGGDGKSPDEVLAGIAMAKLDSVKFEVTHLPGFKIKEQPHITPVRVDSLDSSIRHLTARGIPVVTAFNTQVGMSHILRHKIKPIRRLPLAAELPREDGKTFLFLDVGGNSDMYIVGDLPPQPDPSDVKKVEDYFRKLNTIYSPERRYEKQARNMVDFARLGALYMTNLHDIEQPRVGLLNIGEETGKGNRFIQICNEQLQQENTRDHFRYVGFTEPADLEGVHVLVTDGCTGNLVLKGIEKAVDLTRASFKRNKLMYYFAKMASLFSSGLSTSDYTGAYIPGLRGSLIVIKVHGNASAKPLAIAYRKAKLFSEKDLSAKVEEGYMRRYSPEFA